MEKEKNKHKDCRHYQELKILRNEDGKDICPGLGHCAHEDQVVIDIDEGCKNFKKQKMESNKTNLINRAVGIKTYVFPTLCFVPPTALLI